MQVEDEILKILGRKGTLQILEFLNQHGQVHHKQMQEFTKNSTLNIRTRELLNHRLVEQHLERTEAKKEWYEITEKGKKILQYIHEFLESANPSGEQEKRNKMDETTKMELLALLGSENIREILQYLSKHEKMQHKDFDLSISLPTLNSRLRKLLKFDLVEHCITKKPKRREWYEITGRGKRVSKIMEDMIRLAER